MENQENFDNLCKEEKKFDYICHVDGSKSPDSARCGIVICDSHGKCLSMFSKETAIISSNTSEYKALIYCLEKLAELDLPKGKRILINSDSRLMVNQVTGKWKVNMLHLQEYRDKAVSLINNTLFNYDVYLEWIPREQNEQADDLSKHNYAYF